MERGAVIVAGFGFRKGASASSLQAAFEMALGCLEPGSAKVGSLATAVDKAAALEPLAHALGLPVSGISAQAMAAVQTLTVSAASLRARRTGSVAEASALAAAGRGARLLGPRQISPDRMAACALAQGASR